MAPLHRGVDHRGGQRLDLDRPAHPVRSGRLSPAGEKEFSLPALLGPIDLICGMVTGTPFDMARDGERILGEAADALIAGRRG